MRHLGIPWLRRPLALRLLWTLAPAWLTPCAGDNGPLGPDAGSIRITTATSGSSPDPDGYRVSLDGVPGELVGTEGTLTLAQLRPGDHDVELAEVASNCTVSEGGARTVAVTAGGTAEVAFVITCAAGQPQESPTARLTITAPDGKQSATEGGRLELTVPAAAFVDLTFDASRSAPGAGATIAAYDWQSNGETIGTEPTFTFGLDEGTYLITLKVTDSAGLSNIASATVEITE